MQINVFRPLGNLSHVVKFVLLCKSKRKITSANFSAKRMQSDKVCERSRRLLVRATGASCEVDSVLRVVMSRRIVTYIVACVISSAVVANGHSLNTFGIAPASIHPFPQFVWSYYCYWCSVLVCCNRFYIPRFGTSSNALENLPRWGLTTPIRNVNYNPLLKKPNSEAHSYLVDYYKKILITLLRNSAILSNKTLSLSKTVHDFKNTGNNINSFGTSSATTGDVLHNVKSGRRIETGHKINTVGLLKSNNHSSVVPPDLAQWAAINISKSKDISPSTTQPSFQVPVLRQNTTDYAQSVWNAYTTTSPLDEVPIGSVQNSYKYNGMANTSTNVFYYGKGLAGETVQTERDVLFGKFRATLDKVERKFLLSVFTKLTAISPEDRKENGISFLQSGFFLHQLLISLSLEEDRNATQEIDECLGLNLSAKEKIEILKRTVSWLPNSSDVLKFRWSSRLVLRRSLGVGSMFQRAARAMRLQLSWFNTTETAADLTKALNEKVLRDSGGTMHDTFNEEELSQGECAVALGTTYLRATWRAAPTLLNDTLPFRDAPAAPKRTSRYFRLNDLMGYAYLHEWGAEAIEISYATPGLTLLILVPRDPSLPRLVERVARTSFDSVLGVMHTVRLAVTLPLYTLRMTLLLPNKLQDMGMPSLVTNDTDCQSVKFSHAVQRLMFWAEAGRNAFKDDGIEWDPRPELEIVVDRPYLFFVRWHNITIMNGAFVL